MPERVQMQRTKGWRKPEGAVAVARPARWGNPFEVGSVTSVSVTGADGLSYDDGRPVACHADGLLELAAKAVP